MTNKVGIVGSEAKKFTPETEAEARREIRRLIEGADLVISGHSPLGGIDWWAIEEAKRAGIPTQEYPAGVHTWESVKGVDGFKARNLKIARNSDKVACIVVKTLPPSYKGMEFPNGCYHHTPPAHDHIKSGGCWTMKQAAIAGKTTELVIVGRDKANDV